MDRNEKRDVSEFNSAVSYLNRINILLSNADSSAINLDMYGWFHSLLAVFRELSTEMKDEEITTKETSIVVIRNNLNIHLSRLKNGFTDVNPELYDGLHKFELSLRKIMKESGLQQRIMDEAAKALR